MIDDLIDNLATGQMSKASDAFEDLMKDKISARLKEKEVEIASKMFSASDEE